MKNALCLRLSLARLGHFAVSFRRCSMAAAGPLVDRSHGQTSSSPMSSSTGTGPFGFGMLAQCSFPGSALFQQQSVAFRSAFNAAGSPAAGVTAAIEHSARFARSPTLSAAAAVESSMTPQSSMRSSHSRILRSCCTTASSFEKSASSFMQWQTPLWVHRACWRISFNGPSQPPGESSAGHNSSFATGTYGRIVNSSLGTWLIRSCSMPAATPGELDSACSSVAPVAMHLRATAYTAFAFFAMIASSCSSVVRCADSDEHHTPVLPLLSQSDSSSSHVPDSGQHELSPEDSPQRKGVDAQMENAWTSFVSALQALGYRYMHKIEDKFRVPKDGNIFQVLKDIAISVGVSSSEAHHWARSFSTEDACFFLASLPATIANMRVSCGLETTSDMFHLSLQEISMQTYAPCLPALGSLYKLVQLSPISSRAGVSFSVITGKWYQSSKSSPPPEMALKACISFDDGPPPVKGPIGVEDRQFGPLPSALLEAGFESKREVGRLTKPELKSLLPGWSEFELDAFLSSCLSSSSIDPSTPPRLRSVLPLHAVSIPVAGPRPRRPRKRTDAAPQTVEQIEEEGKVARRWHAEKLIELTLLTCPQSDISKQAAEYHAKDLLHEWKSGLANSIATRFELSSLRPAVSEWNRLIKECADPMDALALHHYISSRADKGNTVGPGVMSKLNFLSRTLSIPFPLQSPILAMWKTATAGHVVHPQEAIPPHIFLHLSDIACSKTCTAARTFSRIILRWLTSGLRFAHTLRATRQVHLSNPSRCIWLVHKGKKSDKSGFYFPVPSHLRQHCAVFSELQSELKQSLGDAADGVFLPDISDGGSITDSLLRSGPCATAYHMTYSKATTIIRGLCELHPLSMSMEQSSELNTYCLRKFLATTAGLLSLDEESSNHIGNWASGQKPMHVRYQSKAMDTGAHVRRMLLAAVEIACMASAQSQPPQQVSWDSVASLRSKMDRLEKLAIKPSWMGNDQVLIVDDFLFESDPPPAKKAKSRSSLESEDSSSSSGSSSDSDSDSSADPEPADSDSAEWYAPPRGLLHFLRSTAEERVPFCSSRPFATRDGCTSGSSIAAARSSGLQFCPTCASKVGIVALILADRLTQAASSAVVAIQPGPPLFHLVVAALELDIDYSHASLWVFLLLVGAMIGCIFTHVFYLVRRLYSALCLRTQEVSNIDPVVSSTNRRNVLVQTPTRYHNGRFTPLASGFHGAWDD